MIYEFDGRMFWAVDEYDRVVWGIDSLDVSPTTLKFLDSYCGMRSFRDEHPEFDQVVSLEGATEVRGQLAEIYVLEYHIRRAAESLPHYSVSVSRALELASIRALLHSEDRY